MTSHNKKSRIAWIDIAKGVGIILVVVGHALVSGRVYSAIYLFHMPLFFILAGVVFRPDNVKATFWKRLRSLMIPYASFLLIVMLMQNALYYHWGYQLSSLAKSDDHQLWLDVEGGTSLTGDFGTFWFVSCLFLSLVAYDGLRSRLKKPLDASMIVVMSVFLLVSYPLSTMSLPWDASIAPLAIFFIWVGECWSTIFTSGKVRADSPGPVMASAVLAAIGLGWFAPFDMKVGMYGTPILSVLAAIAISHLFFVCCMHVSKIPGLRTCIVPLGQSTLVILFMHRFFVLHLEGGLLGGRLPTLAIIAVATAIPFVSWLLIKRSPLLLRQALLGERLPAGRWKREAISEEGSGSS